MDSEQRKKEAAQPAPESLKKHGDQLEKQVEQAAGKRQAEGNEGGPDKTGKSASQAARKQAGY